LSEEDIKKLAEYRLFLEERIKELEDQLETYRGILRVIDENLKKLSFVPATEYSVEKEITEEAEVRPLRRQKDGFLLANAYVKRDSVTIIPAPDVELYTSTPPFRSFFIGKVLEGMRRKDESEASIGRIPRDKTLRYTIDEKDGKIEKITIYNYRERSRLNEIINTATWTFTKMLEKTRM